MNKNSFIKNPELLDEAVGGQDYLGVEDKVKALGRILDSIESNTVIGLVGSFGLGKSTLIQLVREQRESTNGELWISFDAWKFPDRKELWDGLILETARQFGTLKKVKSKIDGSKSKVVEGGIDVADAITKIAAPAWTPAATVIGKFAKASMELINNLPAKRIFEMEDIFHELLASEERGDTIVFVVEDVDRSGVQGLFFLETLKQFISTHDVGKKIVVIAPVSDESYNKNLDSYLKCIDRVEFLFKEQKVDFNNFVDNIISDDIDLHDKRVVADFLSHLYFYHQGINMRKVKLIMRQANAQYISLVGSGYVPDMFVCIAVAASRYVFDADKSRLESTLSRGRVSASGEIERLIVLSNPSFRMRGRNEIVDVDGKMHPTVTVLICEEGDPRLRRGGDKNLGVHSDNFSRSRDDEYIISARTFKGL